MLDVPEAAGGKPCVPVLLLLSLPTPEHTAITEHHGHVQVGHAVGSIALSAAILLSPVQRAHAVTPEQLLFLEVNHNQGCTSAFLRCCSYAKVSRGTGGRAVHLNL